MKMHYIFLAFFMQMFPGNTYQVIDRVIINPPIFHGFGIPIVHGEHIIFNSPHSRKMICINTEGKKIWEKNAEKYFKLFQAHNSQILYQIDKNIYKIDPTSGREHLLFEVESVNDNVRYHPRGDIYYSMDKRIEKKCFKIIDRNTGTVIWKNDTIEEVIYITDDQIIAWESTRVYDNYSFDSYRFSQGALVAYDKKTFHKLWTESPPQDLNYRSREPTYSKPYLIFTKGLKKLTLFNCDTGMIVKENDGFTGKTKRIFSNIKLYGDNIIYVTRVPIPKYTGKKRYKYQLHFCSFPSLKIEKMVDIDYDSTYRVSLMAFQNSYILKNNYDLLSNATLRIACFRANGEKVWEKDHAIGTDVIDNKIYFSDHVEKSKKDITERLGFIDVTTGEETILYTENIK